MPFDEELADRVRRVLSGRRDVEEKAMFGGLAFMAGGHMTVGLVGDVLMVRVGPEAHEALLDEPNVRPMDFTGRPMKGFLYVDPPGLETLSALQAWVDRATRYADSLPAKGTPVKQSRKRASPARRKRSSSKASRR